MPRVISITSDKKAYLVGTIGGRVYINNFNDGNEFSYKCHRNSDGAFAVNDIAPHPTIGDAFATCGSDGSFAFWNKAQRQRLHLYPGDKALPIVCCKFSPNGLQFARAISYDWSRGKEFKDSVASNKIMVFTPKKELENKIKF